MLYWRYTEFLKWADKKSKFIIMSSAERISKVIDLYIFDDKILNKRD